MAQVYKPYGYEHHYMKTTDWINQCFQVQQNENGRPIILPDRPIIDENGNVLKQSKYKIKRFAELWMISLVLIMEIEFNVRNDKKKRKTNDFAFYGTYGHLRNAILNSVDPRLVPQLSRSITVNTISTSMRRAEASGFIKIEYDKTVTNETCSDTNNYRRITLNYDKLMELSEFNLSKERSQTWKKYHSSSREHRFMRKRPVSYLQPLIEDLAKESKKEEFREKLAKLKLKYKNHQDVFKAWILTSQGFYITGANHNLTAVKSKQDAQDEIIARMYQKPVEDKVLTDEEKAILDDFLSKIK